METQVNVNEENVGLSDSNAGLGVDMCRCGNNPATELHSCPFAEEINGNDDPEFCTCCDDCRHECCMDI